VKYTGRAVYTNTCGRCAYRGPWMMETTGREQMMDVVARKLGIDPLEIRRRYVISRGGPFTSPTTLVSETISPAESLEQAAELIGYERFREEQAEARAQGRLLGIGLSLYVEPRFGLGNLGTEAATIRVEPSGKVYVYMGSGSHGQSVETAMAQIVADELGPSPGARSTPPPRRCASGSSGSPRSRMARWTSSATWSPRTAAT
jgi:carbon-monoxide dehydrogenase large subunit